MTRITKDMLIGDIMNIDINLFNVLMGAGMYCITCPASQMESLEEACWVHGIDSDDMADALNEYLEAKAQGQEEGEEAPADAGDAEGSSGPAGMAGSMDSTIWGF